MSDLRKRLYEIVEEQKEGDRLGQAVKLAVMGLIALSVLSVIFETVPALAERYATFFLSFETFTVAVFTVEYLVRLGACTVDPRYAHPVWGRLRMALTPMALVDLVAILPFYLPMVTTLDLRFVRALRLLRLLRLFKLGRYSESLKILNNVLRSKKEELAITAFVAGILLVIFSSLMYYVENAAQPDRFSSIPAAMWWGVATLTTVGYGDIYPVTLGGKVLGALSALVGIGMFAMPAGILGSAFIDEMHRRRAHDQKSCPHCGKSLE
jgi:voltage-gated potassium channel